MFNFLSAFFDRNTLLSLELYIIMIFFLSYALFSAIKKLTKTLENKRFILFMASILISIVFDLLCYFCDEKGGANTRLLNIVSNTCYVSLSMVLSYFWFLFVASKLEFKLAYNNKVLWVMRALIGIHVILTLSSNWTGFLFYIDENGVYQRGSLFFLQLVPWIYSITSLVLAFIRITNKKYIANRSFYWSIVIFSCFPVICECFQLSDAGSPSISIGYSMGSLFMYIILLEDNISSDGLTGLYNRAYLIKFLASKIRTLKKTDETFFFMLDINDFKKINDVYGHIEGDRALIIFATCLKALEKKYQAYIARYGGDEFVIILDDMDETKADDLIAEISNLLSIAVEANELKYKLTISAGYTKCYPSDIKSIDRMISRADDLMYLNKQLNKDK